MKRILSFLTVFFTAALLFNISLKAQNPQENEAEKESKKQENFSRLIEKADRKGSARVIVGLKGDFQTEDFLNESELNDRKQKIKIDQNKFLNRHAARIEKVKKFDFLPLLAFETDAGALAEMQSDAQIEFIEEDELSAPTLAESTALVGAPSAWSQGFSGGGQAVAVLDTGVDKNHSFLSGKIVSEACFSSNYADSTSVCPGGVTESVAVNSGVNCASNIAGCAHGTHVAGIVAGRGTNFSGVAKDAKIISIQVFSSINDPESCGGDPVPCALSYTSDQLKALERVRDLSSSMSIAAVNMSLGGGQYASNCDAVQPSRKALIDSLRSLGIATVVASGNNGYTNAISAPACVSSAISVGSTDDGSYSTGVDTVSNFSNSSNLLTILAPGKYITSSVPGNGFAIYGGTSMAAPHVAGAFAVLKQKKPNAAITELLNALTTTGQSVTDQRNNITKPRIRVDRALSALSGSTTRRTQFDYDGDGRADAALFRPSNTVWYIQNSADASYTIRQFGLANDLSAPADYDGDGRTDIAVFRPSTGVWYWLRSSTGSFASVSFGANGDLPVPADYDGDGRADLAVFRPATGTWWILRSGDGAVSAQQFGLNQDKPTLGDFDGDNRADLAVWRPSTGVWYRLNSSNGQFFSYQFGLAGDQPTAADYDGDGKADLSVFRPASGTWYRLNSANNSFSVLQFGLAADKPVAADFDGDGKADPAVWRPSTGIWYEQRSSAGFAAQQFGAAGDLPAENAFVR